MRRPLAALAVAASAAAMLSGCMVAPPELAPASDPIDSNYDDFYEENDVDDRWIDDEAAWQTDFAETVAVELRAAGSDVAPAEGESLAAFRHVAVGVGWEWCDRTYVDPERIGDADEHSSRGADYGWTAEEYRIVAELAEAELCGY
jgi:dipeptidyl aminopeptidase/acylaminoacyl peptidase